MGEESAGDDDGNNGDQGYDEDTGIEEVGPEDDNMGRKASGGNSTGGDKSSGQGFESFSNQSRGKKGASDGIMMQYGVLGTVGIVEIWADNRVGENINVDNMELELEARLHSYSGQH
jgi:hypothetical protein